MNGNKLSNDPLAVIYNESAWRVSRLSPMYNLQYDELKLKRYASYIRQRLSVSAAIQLKYNVVIEDSINLRYSEDDPSSLMITVTSSQGNDEDKVLYMAILMSWGIHISANNAIHLPFMLDRGDMKIGAEVRNNLQSMFDCNITQCNFTQIQLLQFAFSFVENDTSRSNDRVVLNYKTPQGHINDKISLTFEVGDIHAIWNRVRSDENDSTKLELIHVAYQILQNQIYSSLTLDVNIFDLCEVLLPKSEVKNSGIVKLKTPEIVNAFFTVLNLISHVHWLNGFCQL